MEKENLINLSEKIYIAGSSGMVGSAIYKKFKRNGYGNSTKGGKLFKTSRKELNLLDYKQVEKWFDTYRPSIVIISAAKVGGILANSKYPYEFLLENLKIQNNLIENSFNFRVKRLLFLGSSCIYPKFCSQPIKEENLLSNKLENTNEWYAIAKIAGIKLCESLRIQHDFDAISLMPTNLYGPNDNYHPTNSHVMASLIRKFCIAKKNSFEKVTCWGSGSPLREFMHVDDLANAVLFALERWNPLNTNFTWDKNKKDLSYLNVGTGIEISIKDLAELIANEIGYEGEIFWDESKPDGTPRKLLNSERIKSLGWAPSISLREGIKRTINEIYNNIS